MVDTHQQITKVQMYLISAVMSDAKNAELHVRDVLQIVAALEKEMAKLVNEVKYAHLRNR